MKDDQNNKDVNEEEFIEEYDDKAILISAPKIINPEVIRLPRANNQVAKLELEGIVNQLDNNIPEKFFGKAKNMVMSMLGYETDISIEERKKCQINKLNISVRECELTLSKSIKSREKVAELDVELRKSLIIDRENYVNQTNYIDEIEEAIKKDEILLMATIDNKKQSKIMNHLLVLKDQYNTSIAELDDISIRVNINTEQKRKTGEILKYTGIQSRKIKNTLSAAEKQITFIEKTEGIIEFLRAGGHAAEIHSIYDNILDINQEEEELYAKSLVSFDNMRIRELNTEMLTEANDSAINNLYKEQLLRSELAKKNLEKLI